MLGLVLTLCLAMAVAPIWLSLQKAGVRGGDRTVLLLQARVAIARFERDLRLASAVGCPFTLSTPVLEASPDQVVFVERPTADAQPVLVEWEIVDGALMRRRGVVPPVRPAVFPHSLFVDHKTMVEGLQTGSTLAYVVGGVRIDPSEDAVDPRRVDGVILELRTAAEGDLAAGELATIGRVGR